LWLSGAVETTQDKLMCLNKVLAINPDNEAAQRGVAALQKDLTPPTPVSPSFLETQPVPQPRHIRPSIVQAVLGTAPPTTEEIPTLTSTEPIAAAAASAAAPANAAAMYPYVKVSDMLDHSKSLDELDPEKREALEGFVPLIAQDITVNHLKPDEIIDRISARGFSRKAVEQVVKDIAQQPIRAPIRYEQRLTKEQFESLPSPWLTMWTSPRETMRRIIYYNPKQDVFFLALLDGFVTSLTQVLNQFSQQAQSVTFGFVDPSSMSLLSLAIYIAVCALASPLVALFNLYVYGGLLRTTGRWLGGKAYPVEIRAAVAWAAVPRLWGSIFLVFKLVIVAYSLYVATAGSYVPATTLGTTISALAIVELIIAIWSLVVFLKCVGEAHAFSAWRALGAALLSFLVLGGVIVLSCCLISIGLGALGSLISDASGY
jgi:hypothetical protein